MLKNIILDSNIYLDSLDIEDDVCSKILYYEYKGEFKTSSSNAMLEELLYVFKRDYLDDEDLDKESLFRTMEKWMRCFRRSYNIEPKERLNIIKADKSDNIFLECAKYSHATIIVTNDAHFEEAIGKVKNLDNIIVTIINPNEFLYKLENNQL